MGVNMLSLAGDTKANEQQVGLEKLQPLCGTSGRHAGRSSAPKSLKRRVQSTVTETSFNFSFSPRLNVPQVDTSDWSGGSNNGFRTKKLQKGCAVDRKFPCVVHDFTSHLPSLLLATSVGGG